MKSLTLKLPSLITPALAFSAAAFAPLSAESKASSFIQAANATPRVNRPVLRVPLQAARVSPKFEVAEAGTYADLKAAIDVYKSIIRASTNSAASEPVDWMEDVLQRVDALVAEAESDEVAVPSKEILTIARSVVGVCAAAGATEPSIANDDEGGVEIYLKSGSSGLLVSIQLNDAITIFGDDQKERWRGKYQASGSTWQHHLSRFVGDMLAA